VEKSGVEFTPGKIRASRGQSITNNKKLKPNADPYGIKIQQVKHQQYSVITEESSTARVIMPKNV